MKPLEHKGKQYTNADAWRTAKATSKPSATAEAPPPEQMGGEGEQMDGAQIAQEHGPAMEVHVQHEHEMGAHHVHSLHQDGFEHHSDHASAKEAHEHAAKVGGAHEEPDADEHGGESDDDWDDKGR
jgi:hypothetical protein